MTIFPHKSPFTQLVSQAVCLQAINNLRALKILKKISPNNGNLTLDIKNPILQEVYELVILQECPKCWFGHKSHFKASTLTKFHHPLIFSQSVPPFCWIKHE